MVFASLPANYYVVVCSRPHKRVNSLIGTVCNPTSQRTSESALHLFLFQTGDRFQRILEVLNSFLLDNV